MKATTHFWKWFLEHKNKLKNLMSLNHKEQKHYTYWLNWHLQFYFPGLDYILIYPKKHKQKVHFIITAKGNLKLFKMALELEKTAPKLRDWKITALIKPQPDIDDRQAGEDQSYIMQDITLKTSELKFIPIQYDGKTKIDIIVYLKNFTIYAHNKNLSTIISIMLQDLLGGKTIEKNINLVQLAKLPKQQVDNLIYLYDLQNYIEDINSKRIKNIKNS